MNQKIGALFVTYNPNLNSLSRNIDAARSQVDQCVVVDNGSSNFFELSKLIRDKEAIIICLKKNMGIASAQNKGFEYFKSNDFNWVLTLDQDSLIPENTIKAYLDSDLMNDPQNAIITIGYYDRNWTDEQKRSLVYQGSDPYIEKRFVISSGNLVRISAWFRVSGFDESLFIDMVDYDFDAKLIVAGFKIWQVNSIIMDHAVGEVIHKPILEKILFLPETGLLADHPAFRQYYIYRNTMIFSKRYPSFAHKKMLTIRSLLSTRRMFVYQGKLKKIIASWKGVFDGARYNPKKDEYFIKTMSRLGKKVR